MRLIHIRSALRVLQFGIYIMFVLDLTGQKRREVGIAQWQTPESNTEEPLEIVSLHLLYLLNLRLSISPVRGGTSDIKYAEDCSSSFFLAKRANQH